MSRCSSLKAKDRSADALVHGAVAALDGMRAALTAARMVRFGLAVAALALAGQARADEPPVVVADEGSVSVTRVDTNLPVIALTFDACPTHRTTDGFDREVFEILRREQVPATVFVSGLWLRAHWPEAQELAEEPLIELGNHSYDHPQFSALSVAKGRAEIEETSQLIEALGRHPVGFRPPFGDWPGWLPHETGGLPVVLWDVVSGDAGGHVSPERMVDYVSKTARPGSIVIFHINGNGPNTKKALPEIIQRLRERGMRFVQVSELLRLDGGTIVKAHPAHYQKKVVSAAAPSATVAHQGE